MLGIKFAGANGLGDKLQFSSFPENWHRNTGECVIDLSHSWIFDHNPFVTRDGVPHHIVDLWTQAWPGRKQMSVQEFARKPVYFSQAERTCAAFGHQAYLRHPRLYRFEDLPRLERRVVLHTTGGNYLLSNPPKTDCGEDRQRVLSEEIIDHVRSKYRNYEIIQVGSPNDIDAKVIDCRGIDMWDAAKIIAQASIFIGVDSGPFSIAACYPEVFRKKVLVQYPPEFLRDQFVPMHALQPHVHWHDASCYYYNRSKDDAGVTYSYLKL